MTSQNSVSRSTRSAAIVGAGQTGVTAAIGLLAAGFTVTIYSDRDQRSLRDDVPATGTALEFGVTQQAEIALGLDPFTARAPRHTGLSVRIAGPDNAELIGFDGTFDGYVGVAVDTRLKADERLTAFRERGGEFVVGPVTLELLDTIAAEHDLTLVATGRGGLSDLFAVDDARTVYDAPQRSLLTVTVKGLGFGPEVFAHRSVAGGAHSGFSIFAEQGEAWWGPYLHKDAGPTWAFLGWARPGSDWERRFAAADSAESAHRIVTELYRDYIDWDLPEVLATEVIAEDPHSWLKGAVRPVVREGVGRTASGHVVGALGDTAIAYDPIAGQGAQSGLIQAQRLVAAAAVHDGPFDEAWLGARYAEFLAARGDAANRVTRLFLSDPELGAIAEQFFAAGAVDPRFASAVVRLLHEPQPLLGVISAADAAEYIAGVLGEPAADVLARFQPAGRFARSEYAGELTRTSAG
ncbi:styrene monooxygenase/indole monooxygenase family protein [Nocardia takedensis]